MRAMRIEGAGSTFLVAEHDNLFAQKFFFPRKVAQFVGSAHGLPVAPHQLAHSTVWLDAFDFTAFLLIIAPIAKEFDVPVPEVAAVLTITLWMRLIGALPADGSPTGSAAEPR